MLKAVNAAEAQARKAFIKGATKQMLREAFKMKKSGKMSSTQIKQTLTELTPMISSMDIEHLPKTISKAGLDEMDKLDD